MAHPPRKKTFFSDFLAGGAASGIITSIQTPYERGQLVGQFLQRIAHLRGAKHDHRSVWAELKY